MTHTKANFFPKKHVEMGTPNIEINSKSQAEKAFQDKITLSCNSFEGQRCIEPILTSSEYLSSSTNYLVLLLSSVAFPNPLASAPEAEYGGKAGKTKQQKRRKSNQCLLGTIPMD